MGFVAPQNKNTIMGPIDNRVHLNNTIKFEMWDLLNVIQKKSENAVEKTETQQICSLVAATLVKIAKHSICKAQ